MKRVLLTGIGTFKQTEVPAPALSKGQALVAIKSVGICASDVHYFKSGRIGDQVITFPQTLGHECSGVIYKVRAGSKFSPGDRVAIEPSLGCGTCGQCANGNAHLCSSVSFLGMPGMPGALQEYMAIDERQLFKLPLALTFDEGANLEPAGVACHAVNISGIKKGQSVAVFGAGAIGILTLAIAKIKGAGETFIFDKIPARLALAKKVYGADHTVNVTKNDPVDYIARVTKGRGVDIAFEAAGKQQTFSWTFSAARSGGKALLIGIPSSDTIRFNAHALRRKELLVQNVRRSNGELEECMMLSKKGLLNLKPIATHRFPLEQTQKAFQIAAGYKDGVIRAMITM